MSELFPKKPVFGQELLVQGLDEGGAPKAERILLEAKPPTETCGNCRFSQIVPQDLNMMGCLGAPPTPVVLGMRKNVAGQMEPHIESVRPFVPRSLPGCALWRLKAGAMV